MKTFLRLLFCLSLFAVKAIPALGTEVIKPLRPILPTPSALSSWRLNGIVFSGTKGIASISAQPKGVQTGWFEVNDPCFGQVVTEITTTTVTLQNPQTGAETKLFLAASTLKDAPTATDQPEPFSKAWVNSMANPMVQIMQPLPIEIQRSWVKLSPGEKQAIIDMYLKYGWKLLSAEVVGESVTFAWENIYQQERREMLQANRKAFEATLTPAQHARYAEMRANQPLYTIKGELPPDRKKQLEERKQTFQEFQDSLTPAQREAYEASLDFTKGKWKD
ncbi:MAG: hypothetical protein JNG83_02910 [Opitutaceae bacterium]|nr:hypothetical protein [Opitutaceae bacterium]